MIYRFRVGDESFRLLIAAHIRLMDKILHDLKDSKLWEFRYIPCNG